jgi:mRNA-degrading endonuclease RelE of RelBE toxin-antitoxin system
MYRVVYNKSVEKKIKKMPVSVQEIFKLLVDDLREKGLYQADWLIMDL